MPPRGVRLADVAEAAGVSVPTASQVMNGTGRVAPETRRRVLEVARQLDYRPNALARSVALGRSRTIGVLAENAAGAFCMPVLIGVTRALSTHDLASVLFDARHDVDVRAEHIRHMLDRQVDGIIVIGEGVDVSIAALGETFHGPVVHAFGPADAGGAISIRADEREGGALAARKLVELGRRRIAYVAAERDLASVQSRRDGFASELAAHGLEPVGEYFGAFSTAWGYDAARRILAEHKDVDGIFAGNDAIAVGLAAQLTADGIRIPDDVALVGYDNVAGYRDDVDPYLTSVDPQLQVVGERAANYLISVLENEDADSRPVTPAISEGASTRGGGDAARRVLAETLLRSIQAPEPPRA